MAPQLPDPTFQLLSTSGQNNNFKTSIESKSGLFQWLFRTFHPRLDLNQASFGDYLEPSIHFSPSMTNSFIKLLLKGRGVRDILRCKNFVYFKKKKNKTKPQLFLAFIKETQHGEFLAMCTSVSLQSLTGRTRISPAVHFFLGKWKHQSLSSVQLFVTPWTAARQAPLSMEFSRQEYWNG